MPLWLIPLVAFGVATLVAVALIPWLQKVKFGQVVRDVGPQAHLLKQGTPTMGGIIFLIAMVGVGLLAGWQDTKLLFFMIFVIGFAGIGFWDDYLKVVKKRPLGLRARAKLLSMLVLALMLVWAVVRENIGLSVLVPFTGYVWNLGFWYVPFVILVVLGTVNAVNLTDGLDGLAAGNAIVAFSFYAWYLHATDQISLLIGALTLIGGLLGFLLFNLHPAKVFMGDTGSLALGGGLSVLAVFSRTELILPLVGIIFVVEAASVILQVFSFQVFHRRIFRMSPLHHHFELLGWSEQKVVRSFWIVGLCGALISYLALI